MQTTWKVVYLAFKLHGKSLRIKTNTPNQMQYTKTKKWKKLEKHF